MSRHEETEDHKSCIAIKPMESSMHVAMTKAYEGQDKAIVKALKMVYWLF